MLSIAQAVDASERVQDGEAGKLSMMSSGSVILKSSSWQSVFRSTISNESAPDWLTNEGDEVISQVLIVSSMQSRTKSSEFSAICWMSSSPGRYILRLTVYSSLV